MCAVVGHSRTLALQHMAWKRKENSVNVSVHEWVGVRCTVVHKLGGLPQGNTVEPPIVWDGRLAVTRPPTGPGRQQLTREHTHTSSYCHHCHYRHVKVGHCNDHQQESHQEE